MAITTFSHPIPCLSGLLWTSVNVVQQEPNDLMHSDGHVIPDEPWSGLVGGRIIS